jgi:hypothetical protein
MLGNLSVSDIEKRIGVQFSETVREKLVENRQQDLSTPIDKNKWHCFDIPFMLVCGGADLATIVTNDLKTKEQDMTNCIRIAINK